MFVKGSVGYEQPLSITLVTVAGADFSLCLLSAVGAERTSNIIALFESPFRSSTRKSGIATSTKELTFCCLPPFD